MEFYLEGNEEKIIEYLDIISINIPKKAFKEDVILKFSSIMSTIKSDHALSNIDQSFKINGSTCSSKPLALSFLIRKDILGESIIDKSIFFIEYRVGNFINIVNKKLSIKKLQDNATYILDDFFMLPLNEDLFVTLGIVSAEAEPCDNEVFHPVPHHFKMSGLDRDNDGNCRRRDSDDCTDLMPQGIYPMCIPAGKASLYSAYKLVLPNQQRRWHMGTPLNHNPSPDEDGDYFSTMSVGAMRNHLPSRVEDWSTGEQVEIVTLHFGLNGDVPLEEAVEQRANLIDRSIRCYVGGSLRTGSAKPVYIQHSGHGWIIIGVERDGFWSHAQNPESAGLSDWCTWENAPWRRSSLGEHNQPFFQILYPKNCNLRQVERRLGSFSMWGSGPSFAVRLPAEL